MVKLDYIKIKIGSSYEKAEINGKQKYTWDDKQCHCLLKKCSESTIR